MSGLRLQFVIEALDRATAPVRAINRTLDKLKEPMDRMRAAWGGVRDVLGGVARAVTLVSAAVGSGLFGIKRISDAVDNINDTAQALGMTTERFQQMAYAAQLSGSSQDEMSQALIFLNRNMGEARKGSKEALDMFSHVGITMKDLRTLNAGQIFERMADVFKRVGDAGNNAGKKVELTTALLGRSGYRLIQMMNSGSGSMRVFYAEAKRLGVILSDETIKAMADFNDSWDRMRLTIFGVMANALTPVMAVLKGVVDRIVEWTAANRGLIATNLKKFVNDLVAGFPAFVGSVKRVLEAVTQLVDVAGRVVATLGGWPNVIALLVGLLGAQMVGAVLSLVAAFASLNVVMLANPMTWVLAAVTALIVALPLLVLQWDKVIEKLQQLNAAMPDWMRDPSNWAVVKLLGALGLKGPSSDVGEGDQRPREIGRSSIWDYSKQPSPSGDGNLRPADSGAVPWESDGQPRPGPGAGPRAPGMVVSKKDSVSIGGTLNIRIDQEGKAKVKEIRKLPQSPMDLDVYLGPIMTGF